MIMTTREFLAKKAARAAYRDKEKQAFVTGLRIYLEITKSELSECLEWLEVFVRQLCDGKSGEVQHIAELLLDFGDKYGSGTVDLQILDPNSVKLDYAEVAKWLLRMIRSHLDSLYGEEAANSRLLRETLATKAGYRLSKHLAVEPGDWVDITAEGKMMHKELCKHNFPREVYSVTPEGKIAFFCDLRDGKYEYYWPNSLCFEIFSKSKA